jgi:hypothetical protein
MTEVGDLVECHPPVRFGLGAHHPTCQSDEQQPIRSLSLVTREKWSTVSYARVTAMSDPCRHWHPGAVVTDKRDLLMGLSFRPVGLY